MTDGTTAPLPKKRLRRLPRKKRHNPVDDTVDFIMANMVQCDFGPGEFLPANIIKDMFTFSHMDDDTEATSTPMKRLLGHLVVENPASDDEILARFVVDRARKVFLTCILSLDSDQEEIFDVISMFLEEDFDDSKLPIERHDGKVPMSIDNQTFSGLLSDFIGPMKARHIHEAQWKFLAPVFSTKQMFYDIEKFVPLPFVSDLKAPHRSEEGTYGSVQRRVIHLAHFVDEERQKPATTCVFAVKEFKKDRKDASTQWENEVRALRQMNVLQHQHIVYFITAFRLSHGSYPNHYICFEWADGGNLTNLWNDMPQPRLSASMIRAVTEQLQGLAQALRVTHYLIGIDGRYSNEPYIHGDLKPKNILWFQEGGEIGTLKIGDWGNAKKVHGANTATRTNGSGNYGTRRYEPPEVETGTIIDGSDSLQDSRSRLYDLWSFGCFTLEFIIWLLHGKKGLDQFHGDKKGDYGISDSFYEIDPHANAKVHGVVDHWMDSMEKDPLCCIGESALGDLLDVVRQGLLVVKLPKGGGSINARVETYPRFLGQDLELQRDDSCETDPNGTDIPKISTLIVPGVQKESSLELTHLLLGSADSSEIKIVVTKDDSHQARESMHTRHESIESVESPLQNDGVFQPERFRAIELESNLCRIFQSHESGEYWYKDVPHQPMPSTFRKQPLQLSSKIPGNYDGPRKDPEDWRFSIDNAFAATLFEKLDKNLLLPKDSTVTTSLCEKCSETFGEEITSPFFSVTYSTSRLSMNANAYRCELCVLLWQVCKDYTSTEHTTVQFDRRGSNVLISHRRAPVLSLFCDYDNYRMSPDIQTGFHELPAPGQELHFGIIQGWLHHCDNEHWANPRCKPSRFKTSAAGSITKIPTRLIAVGIDGEDMVRLQETRGMNESDCRWVALSYQWGPPPHFETTRQNMNNHRNGIKLHELPQTFQDAVKVTRASKRQHLWIDSICIIQGPDGDFNQEAKTMEDVYNGADFVIAASAADSQNSGFLHNRKARQRVTVSPQHNKSTNIHICQMVDDFEQHVLQGDLSRRGWVLQEHALARRTVFFTEYQTYWECGHGVRCETMTTMENDHASLLADPDFPKRLEPAEHGEFMLRVQGLFSQYSRLGLTRDYDRFTAIAGLQKRLLNMPSMKLQGNYGIFDNHEPGLLRRCLLWHRSLDNKTMTRIKYPKEQEVPSWSWMAFSGAIDYFPLTFGGFAWQDLHASWPSSDNAASRTSIKAKVQTMDLTKVKPFEALIVLDIPTDVDQDQMMAVALGIEEGETAIEDRKHYVLVVVSKHLWGHRLYERVGAGYVPGRCFIGEVMDCVLV